MYNIISFKVNVIKIGAKDQRYETLPSPPFIESPNIRAVTNPKKISDPDPNPNEFFCRISDPDPIIHKKLYKT